MAEPVLHAGVSCDGCGELVRGMRYKCSTCNNYDLCAACNVTGPENHAFGRHLFLEIRRPLLEASGGNPPTPLPVQRPVVRTMMMAPNNGRRGAVSSDDED